MSPHNLHLLYPLAIVAVLSVASGCLTNFDSDPLSDSGGGDVWMAEAGEPDASTVADARCGNDIAEAQEACDGPDLRGQTCTALGHAGGELACAADCSFDVSGCEGEPECTGSCAPCGSHLAEVTCGAQVGCNWVPAACTGTPNTCTGSNLADCVYGCDWDLAGPCLNGQQDCGNITLQVTCVDVGCVYAGGTCTAGQSFDCADVSTGQQCIDGTGGVCQWDDEGPCSGTANPCTGRQEPYCELGCVWQVGTCEGTCQPCALLDNQSGCEGQSGCTWGTTAVR